jgi:hypothetical protein
MAVRELKMNWIMRRKPLITTAGWTWTTSATRTGRSYNSDAPFVGLFYCRSSGYDSISKWRGADDGGRADCEARG